jgi:hypothetical protein
MDAGDASCLAAATSARRYLSARSSAARYSLLWLNQMPRPEMR